MSPQAFLNALLQDDDPRRAKYYSTESYFVKDSAYYNQPTAFQLKSYGSHLTDMVRRSNAHALRDMLVSSTSTSWSSNDKAEATSGQLGLSPNACNVYGESILTMICRRGDLALLQVLMDTGCCSLQVSDDCGRTPLHDACWSSNTSQPCFEVVQIILQADARLLYMKDARGSLPLDYVPKQHWDAWKRFLVRVVLDAYFPIVDDDDDNVDADNKKQGPPELTKYAPNSRPVSTPPNSLPNALAAMVAFGKLTPDEARMMASPDSDDDDYSTDDNDSDDDEATVDSSTSNCDDDDDSSSSSSCSSGSDSDDYDSGEDYDTFNDKDDDEEEEEDEEDDDDESYDFARNNNPDEEDMDQAVVMTGSLLTGTLL
jgi:hypothetical protein